MVIPKNLRGRRPNTLDIGMSRSEITGAGPRLPTLAGAVLGCSCLAAAWPYPGTAQVERWTLERTVTIGDAFDPETGLTRVGDVIVLGDRLLVTQDLERRVRVFSLTGDFLGFIGRGGEGPGEFWSVGSMGLHDGRMWIDSGSRRLQYFDAEGRLVSSERIEGHPALLGATVQGVLQDGSRLFKHTVSAGELVESPPKPEAVILVDPEGLPRDTVAMIVGRSGITQFVGSGWTSYVSIPESYRSLLSVAPDGSGFVVVHRTGATSAEPHTFRVIRFDARADTTWAHEVPYDPIPVPREWRARHVEEYVRDFGEFRGFPPGRVRQAWERAFGRLEFFPPVGDVQAGTDGTTWLLLRTGVESSEWEVLDESGRTVARVDAPPRGGIRWADAESLWFVERDELDVPYLVRYLIRRP